MSKQETFYDKYGKKRIFYLRNQLSFPLPTIDNASSENYNMLVFTPRSKNWSKICGRRWEIMVLLIYRTRKIRKIVNFWMTHIMEICCPTPVTF